MKKILLSSAFVATFALLAACGDDVTEVYQEGLVVLESGEQLDEELCSKDNLGDMLYVADSSKVFFCDGESWMEFKGEKGEAGDNGDDGTSCTASVNKDGNFDLVCGGKTIGTIKNGANGKDGLPGEDGVDGDDGMSCTANVNKDGNFDLVCGGKTIGTIKNGANGKDGLPGEDGVDGEDGESCEVSREGNVLTITCANSEVAIDLDELIQISSNSTEESSSSDDEKSSSSEENSSSSAMSSSAEIEESSSSNVIASSSSAEESSSSEEVSSSSEEESSSSSVIASSSSAKQSSSSEEESSSSNVIASSSSAEESSSSEEVSSSSEECSSSEESSSSEEESSSSEAVAEVKQSGYYEDNCPVGHNCRYAAPTTYLKAGITYGEILDTRDDQVYKVVTIGEGASAQTWMAQNLNYDYNKGTAKSYCYNSEADSCAKYGRLYTWAAAMDKAGCGYGESCSNSYEGYQGICPEGWHLPTYAEWDTLFTNVGGENVAGRMLKSEEGWNYYSESSTKGIDYYDFSALPAGIRHYNGDFIGAGNDAYFWSSSEFNGYNAYFMYLYYYRENAYLDESSKGHAFSVRCLQNN